MAELLTQGAIKEILLNPNNLPKDPVLQVLGLKKVTASQGSAPNERYRMVLSDSVHAHTCAMLATQLNYMVNENKLDAKAIIRLDKYICNVIQGTRKVLILLEVTVLRKGVDTQRFGEPVQYDEKTDKSSPPKPNNKPAVQQSSVSSTNRNRPTPNGSRFGSNQAPASRTQNGPSVFPISSLNPYQSRWTICARVTSKSSIRDWSNSRGQGRLFNVDLIDESGEIRATCFTDLVDNFYPLLEQNKVYYISKGSLRPANKKYSSINNDYELTFNRDTTIEPCNEVNNLPTLQFNFREIAKIPEVQADQLTDIIGVCSSTSDVIEITTRAGKQVQKRDITLLDQTASVNCTLWGKEAEEFEQYVGAHPIVAIKGAKVSDFGGRSLSILNSSVMQVDPDNLQEAFKLRGWYDSVGSSANIASISGHRSEGMVSKVFKNVEDIQLERLGSSEKPDYFNMTLTTTYYRKENCLYKACPKQDCNKKVIEDGNHYRCEKCNQTYPDFKHRLIMRVNTADHTGEQWLTFFQDTAEQLLEKTADEIGQLRETDEKAFEQLFNRKNFLTRVFHIRAKVDTYNDESRVQCTVDKVSPVDFPKETRRLVDEIDKLMD